MFSSRSSNSIDANSSEFKIDEVFFQIILHIFEFSTTFLWAHSFSEIYDQKWCLKALEYI